MKSDSWNKNNSLSKIKEDYGWEVSYDNIWNLYEDMKEAFGAEELLESIVRAMGTYDLGDTLTYICRMNDYNSQYLEGHEEDEEEDEEEELDESKKSRGAKLNEKVEPSNARALLDDMIEAFGSDIILKEISKSMGNVELADNLSYVAENLRFKHHLIWNDED